MFTPFGKKLRNYRIEHGIKLKDLADVLQVTSSYLSAIEMGKKNVPDALLIRIAEYLRLDRLSIEELKRLAEESKKINKVDTSNLSRDSSFVVAAFARGFDQLTPEERQKIKEMINRVDKKES
jgi:HTH-type transcriptional regulator, competence development regulator